MGEIILVTGGCRSGKSSYAENLIIEAGGSKLYIATAPVLDNEMRMRVKRHKDNRAGKGWDTIEEEVDIAKVLSDNSNYDTVLVDCLTLWINNLIYRADLKNEAITEDIIANNVAIIMKNAKKIQKRVVFVINEVGMGVVPENTVARLFRDLSGRCSQCIAQNADRVILMSCGLPLNLKV